MNNRTYDEKLVLTGCLIGVLGFLPFTIYRYINGDYLVACLESSLAMLVLCVFIYVWRTHKVALASFVMCTLFLGVATAVVHIKGPQLVYWVYPCTLATFCILDHRTAAVLNLFSYLLILPALYPVIDSQEILIIYATLTLLSLFGYTFTTVTQKQRLQLSQLAERDALTGALNRRALDENMMIAINQTDRMPNWASSMIILDLDHFKEINDTYGHSTGDQILIRIAELIRSNIRISDRLFRYGGEEFVILVGNAKLADAEHLAESIRQRVEKSNLFEKRGVTISLGVAELLPNQTAGEWLSCADDALYRAKGSGRNRVCAAARDTLDITSLPDTLSLVNG